MNSMIKNIYINAAGKNITRLFEGKWKWYLYDASAYIFICKYNIIL